MCCVRIVTLVCVVVLATLTGGRERHNSKRLQWEDDSYDAYSDGRQSGNEGRSFHYTYQDDSERDDRKLIFINNKAYDLSDSEQQRVWEMYLKKGYVPDTHNMPTKSNLNSLTSALNAPVASVNAPKTNEHAATTRNTTVNEENPSPSHSAQNASYPVDPNSTVDTPRLSVHVSGVNNLLDAQHDIVRSRVITHQDSVKSSRFVADPSKAHLIQKVDDDEMKAMYETTTTSTTTPPVDNRVATEASVEAVTVHYEYTRVSLLEFFWNELRNIGELLGREMVDTISSKLWYWWMSLVKFVQARAFREIQDNSSEL